MAKQDRYQFQIGAWECFILKDSQFQAPASYIFKNAPEEALAQALAAHNLTDPLTIPVHNLLLRQGDQMILIDTGSGPQSDGQLMAHLDALDIAPEAVDILILTHAHSDHLGGMLTEAGAFAFPHARHLISQTEWDFWTPKKVREALNDSQRDVIEKYLLPYENQVGRINPEYELIPGVRLIEAPGHTGGHMIVQLTSGGETLLHTVDISISPIHIEHPEWLVVQDHVPEKVASTRREIYSQAATEQILLFANHFDFPGLGHVTPHGAAWQWQPL